MKATSSGKHTNTDLAVMSQKRALEEEAQPIAEEVGGQKRRKVPSLRNVVLEVMKLRTLQQFIEPVLEPMIRKVVKEEVELALRRHMAGMRNSGEETEPSDSRSLKLQFLDVISLPVFTGSRIEGEDGTAMKVALIDALTGQVVCSGALSSAKVEVVVLEGDFDGNVGDNWTREEFKINLVREREGKKALLNGDTVINLVDGIGLVGDISFTDNSSWTRSRKFRLGARIVDNCDGTGVREAKTESFIVRDHRGELYKKHHPPSLFDEVWRLEKIGKEGAFHKRLSRERITTVKDFLILLHLDPARLRYILGTGMSAKMWEVTVEHAKTCVLDMRVYLYRPRSHETSGVVFNVVGQVRGLFRDGQYVLVDELSEAEKADAHNLVILAFKQWEDVVAFDDQTSLLNGTSLLPSVYYPSNSSMEGSSDGLNIVTSENFGSFGYPQLDGSTSDIMTSIYSLGHANNMNDFRLHGIESMHVNFGQSLSFPDHVANSLICDRGSITQSLRTDDPLQYFDTDCSLQNPCLGLHADLHSAVSEFLHGRSSATAGTVRAQRRWRMLFSVLRWLSVRRIVARKSMTEREVVRVGTENIYLVTDPCPSKLFRSEMQVLPW